jgi:two-component system, NarL family, sensor histidine kinase DesK
MNSDLGVSPAEAQWVATQRRWTRGWRRYLLAGAFLVYLLFVIPSVANNRQPLGAVLGFVILVAFAACFLALVREGQQAAPRRFWGLYGVLVALFAAELPLAGDASFVMCLYLTGSAVMRLDLRAAPIVVLLALASLLVPAAVPSWHTSVKDAFDSVTPLAILIVALVSLGGRRVFEGNRALAEARAELARLSAENERNRIARDLHDLLGHSLTTITVKAGLARQIGELDPARALQEIAEVETLARRSLSDVRAAVTNYREVTLAGELATGRELLRAAGITAELPHAAEITDATQQELFGWAVREGLTNVVRHAHASACTVRLSPTSVEILDDGIGASAPSGNGLDGLRERVAAAGGIIDAGPEQPRGWRLRVSLPPTPAA